MSRILPFRLFESHQLRLFQEPLTGIQKRFLDSHVQGKWRVNPATGLVDIDGDLACEKDQAEGFRGIRFGHVSGSFKWINSGLRSLDGAPHTVEGDFEVQDNKLESLQGGPQKVGRKFKGGEYNCARNLLRSLEGAPREVDAFDCRHNRLITLEGGPIRVRSSMDCSGNPLTNLRGAPRHVKYLNCENCGLSSLEGVPLELETLLCSGNSLRSLDGGPTVVQNFYRVTGNPLVSLSGFPDKVNLFDCGTFWINYGLNGVEALKGGRAQRIREIWESFVKHGLKEESKFPSFWTKHRRKTADLLLGLLPEEELDAWMRENPMEIGLLDEFPQIQKGVIARTGLKKGFGSIKTIVNRGLL